MHVSELNNEELYQLKQALYYNNDVPLTYKQCKIISQATFPDDIPDSLVFEVYYDVDFVKEDFFCNVN